jgi:hypothetical protein
MLACTGCISTATAPTKPFIDPEPKQELDNGTEPLTGSGFEEEQPEPDFDERI